MTYAEFQQEFERLAGLEKERFDRLSVSDLILEVRAGRLGECYQIWRSLGERASPREINELLLAYLSSGADYLHRYHCAAALIAVNGIGTAWEPAQLSAEAKYPVSSNLELVRAQLAGV